MSKILAQKELSAALAQTVYCLLIGSQNMELSMRLGQKAIFLGDSTLKKSLSDWWYAMGRTLEDLEKVFLTTN